MSLGRYQMPEDGPRILTDISPMTLQTGPYDIRTVLIEKPEVTALITRLRAISLACPLLVSCGPQSNRPTTRQSFFVRVDKEILPVENEASERGAVW